MKIAVVLATRDRKAALEKCLKSFRTNPLVDEYAVVYDTGEKPLGCCMARNKGVWELKKNITHVYFTDDDCVLEADCLEKLASAGLWDTPWTAAVGGPVLNMSTPHRHEKVWKYNTNPMQINNDGNIVDLSEFYVDKEQTWPADHLRGGNMLVSREAFKKVGGFSKEYGPGSLRGETDLCLKLRAAEYRLYFLSTARVHHYTTKKADNALEQEYDKLWRRKWSPKKFLSPKRIIPPVLIICYGLRR